MVFVRNAQNSYLRDCINVKEPFLYKNKKELPQFQEKRFIMII